jgi:hypothetical protein
MNDEENKKYIAELVAAGYKVQLDKDGKVLFASYWHPELIISKIELK